MANIYLALGGQRTGPFSIDQVQEFCRSGAANRGTLFWQSGQVGWQELERLPGVFGAEPLLDPAVPPAVPAAVSTNSRLGPAPGDMIQRAHPTSGAAIASLICGALAIFGGVFPVIGLPLPIAAIICGHIGRRNIQRSGGRLEGKGIALVGLILGYLSGLIALAVLVFMLWALSLLDQSHGYRSNALDRTAPAVPAVVPTMPDETPRDTPETFTDPNSSDGSPTP